MYPTTYYQEYYIRDNKEEIPEQPMQNQKLEYKQKQTEEEALELTYSHLGRLLQSAEMLAYKLNLIKNNHSLRYQSYDTFDIAEKKSIDTLKYDVINFLDFYEKAIIIHNKKFNYVHPASINEALKDLNEWKNRASKDDKRFFSTIIDLIKTGKYDYSAFPDQNQLYQKATQDNSKFKKNAGFWKTFSVPILKFLDNLIKGVQDNMKLNPNYKPDIHFGAKPTNNSYLKETVEFKKKEMEINSKLNEINTILFSISQKKGNIQNLVEVAENLNNLIIEFKKKYGDEVEFDQNAIALLKNLICTINLDKKIAKKLNDICIDIDPESVQ
jgi:hypothetical protein